jgi:hypothetical protein
LIRAVRGEVSGHTGVLEHAVGAVIGQEHGALLHHRLVGFLEDELPTDADEMTFGWPLALRTV